MRIGSLLPGGDSSAVSDRVWPGGARGVGGDRQRVPRPVSAIRGRPLWSNQKRNSMIGRLGPLAPNHARTTTLQRWSGNLWFADRTSDGVLAHVKLSNLVR